MLIPAMRCRCDWRAGARRAAYTLARWLYRRRQRNLADRVGGAFGETVSFMPAGRWRRRCGGPMAWLSVRAPGRLQRILEGLPLLCRRIARRRGGTGAGDHHRQGGAAALPDGRHRAPRLYYDVPAARAGGLRTSIAQAPVELERAAMALGRTPFQADRQTTMRLAAPGIAASTALVALGITNELTATLMLAPTGTSHAGDEILVADQRARLCRGGALCGDDGAAVAAAYLRFFMRNPDGQPDNDVSDT
jgi:iron(III) transport system permease protein